MPTPKRGQRKTKAKRRGRGRAAGRAEAPPASEPTTSDFLVDEGLTPAQSRFVEEFCANPTMPAVHAARFAYPNQTEDSLRVTASENLAKPNIRAAIQRRLSPTLHKTRASKERVLQLLGDSINADKRGIIGPDGSILPFQEWPPELARLCTGFDHEEIKLGATGPVIGRVMKPRFVSHGELVNLGARANRMLTDRVEHDSSSLEDLIARAYTAGTKAAS